MMSRISIGKLVWSLRRYTSTKEELWDRVCGRCKQTLPVFEYEHHDEQEKSHFSYLCEGCAQKSWQNGCNVHTVLTM